MFPVALRRVALILTLSGAIVLAQPIGAFASTSSHRQVAVGVSEGSNAYLGVEHLDVVVDDQNQGTEILRLSNNVNEQLALDVSVSLGAGLEQDSGFAGSISPGGETTYSVTCVPGSGSGTSTVELTVTAATGSSVSIRDLSRTYQVQRSCPGNNPGGGFDSVSASDVSAFVRPGDERQTFSFDLAGNRKPNEEIAIHLGGISGVDYSQTFATGDVQVESGQGYVTTSGSTIVYHVAPQDGKNDQIVISVGSYSTGGASGPHSVTFTRRDSGQEGTATFRVDPGTYWIENVHSGKAMDANDDRINQEGANVQQWSYWGGANQHWVLIQNADGTYRLRNVDSGMVLSVAGQSSSEGASLVQRTWTGTGDQRWTIVENSDGTYRLVNEGSGYVADVSGWSTSNGGDIIQWTWHNGANQKWILHPV